MYNHSITDINTDPLLDYILSQGTYSIESFNPAVMTEIFNRFTLPSLDDFTKSLCANGYYKESNDICGLYVPGKFGYPVIQQPNNTPQYVDKRWVITQFELPKRYGNIGLLAHNDKAGKYFFDLKEDACFLIDCRGNPMKYTIYRSGEYMAYSPTEVYSKFKDLNTPEQKDMDGDEVFNNWYKPSGEAALQTCIDRFGNASWGRKFWGLKRDQ